MEEQNIHWSLDKRVPIGLLLMIVAQTITLVYVGTAWKSDIDHRLVSLERADEAKSPQGNRILVLEQQFGFIQQTLGRIERKLDQLPPTP